MTPPPGPSGNLCDMSIAVWIVSGLLAAAYLFSGSNKLFRRRDALKPIMPFVESLAPWQVKVIGALEILGAVGLIVPVLTGVASLLTPIAAVCLLPPADRRVRVARETWRGEDGVRRQRAAVRRGGVRRGHAVPGVLDALEDEARRVGREGEPRHSGDGGEDTKTAALLAGPGIRCR